MDYRYKEMVSGDIDRPDSFYAFLEIMKFKSFKNNLSNSIHDASDKEWYKEGYGIPYWPQNLFVGKWYYLGEMFVPKDEMANTPYVGNGFYKLVGTTMVNEDYLENVAPYLHNRFVLEHPLGFRIEVRPGTVLLAAETVARYGYQNAFGIPWKEEGEFKKYWPEVVKICGVEKRPDTEFVYSPTRNFIDLGLMIVVTLTMFVIWNWNIFVLLLLGIPMGIVILFQSIVVKGDINKISKFKKSKRHSESRALLLGKNNLSANDKKELFKLSFNDKRRI